MLRRSPLAAMLVYVLVLAACAGGADEPATTAAPTTTTTTTTLAPTTTQPAPTTSPPTTVAPTTTARPLPTSPITGLPVNDESSLARRVVAIKIDNHANARPQSALEQADAVYELLVEAGLTRFIALFHHTDSTYIGPMRSGRPTDIGVVKPLGATFFISGMQPWVKSMMRREEVLVIEDIRPASFRIEERNAPQNLYANSVLLRDVANERGYPDEPPPPLFDWGEVSSGEPATTITFDWSNWNQVTWRWDGNRYSRWMGGRPHWFLAPDGISQSIVKADTLVVLFGRQYTAHPPASGTSVPATETVGSGRALVFSAGTVREGTWARESTDEPFALTDASGQPMSVPPGVPWISIFPNTREVTWS